MKTVIISTALAATLAFAAPAVAQKMEHKGHAGHTMGDTTEAVTAAAVVHKVDAEKSMINVTHEPVPAIKWPQMTMDLMVTKRVDLSKLKSGDKVMITLKQGVDKQYRVMAIEPAK